MVGVDIGTTSTKVTAYDTSGRRLAGASAGYPLDEPQPGWAEQDPGRILDAVLTCLHDVVSDLDGPVAGLSFSSAMHTLIGLDAAGSPLTPSLSWADSRATAQADRLRAAPGGLALHRRTGTPVHPMAPLPKLVWFREERPKLFARVACWAGIKDYVLSRMCGALVTDHSVASGTGLLDLGTAVLGRRRRWSWPASGRSSCPSWCRPPPCCPGCRPRSPTGSGCRRPRRWSSAPATGRWPTSASARCTPASPPARSAPAARCG